jgi:hypothetical protein
VYVVSIPARRQNEPAIAPCGICCRVLEYPRRARKQLECGRTQRESSGSFALCVCPQFAPSSERCLGARSGRETVLCRRVCGKPVHAWRTSPAPGLAPSPGLCAPAMALAQICVGHADAHVHAALHPARCTRRQDDAMHCAALAACNVQNGTCIVRDANMRCGAQQLKRSVGVTAAAAQCA